MLKLIKQGRWIRIEGEVQPKLESALYRHLAYEKEGGHFMANPMFAWVRFYQRRRKIFPWGLWSRAKPVFDKWKEISGEEYVLYAPDIGAEKVDLNILKKEGLRPYQIDAVNNLIYYTEGIVACPVASGKTKIAITFLKYTTYKKVLIIVPLIDLKNQWKEEVEKAKLKNIDVMTYQGIKKDKYFMLLNYDKVIYDECHHVPSKALYNIAMHCSNAKIIGLCLERHTGINMGDGSHKYLHKIKKGEEVLSYNIKEQKFESKKILNIFKKTITDYYYEIKIQRYNKRKYSIVRCSKNHKFFTNNGYVKAEELKQGDNIKVYSDSPYKYIVGVWNKNTKGLLFSHRKGLSMEKEYGKIRAKDMKNSISRKLKGHIIPLESRQKRSKTLKERGIFAGSNNPRYTTGISFMKRKLKKEVGNICQICFSMVLKRKRLHVHHKNGDKKDNRRENLIVCCQRCHYLSHTRKKYDLYKRKINMYPRRHVLWGKTSLN